MKREVKEAVLAYPRLKMRLDEQRSEEDKKVLIYIDEIASDYRLKSIKKLGAIIDMTLLRLYDQWNIVTPPTMNLSHLMKNAHVVFVPNHQSHVDYLILNYILHTRFDIAPYIAGGINLNVFPIGKIFRQSGCFFIRRSFNNNALYKLTLEAYIAHLLQKGESIEFFYEGGRSRTGKLMPPKYGLFQLLLEGHHQIRSEKPLAFIPVSIAHEVVPEHKALVREMQGAPKEKESFGQILKLYKLLTRRFGSVHIQMGEPIFQSSVEVADLRETTQKLAFRCYHAVGKGIQINSYALLAFILLDNTSGSVTWDDIMERAKTILDYCRRFGIPCVKGLLEEESLERTLDGALQLMLDGNKLQIIEGVRLQQTYYTVTDSARMDLLYSKNTILHHFLVPFLINFVWINVFNGRVKNPKDVKSILLAQRDQLKYEFYLPTTKDLFLQGLEILSSCMGREIKNIEDCFNSTPREIYAVAEVVAPFVNSFRYIYEAYYVASRTLLYFQKSPFSREKFLKVGQEIFEMERAHGRFVRHRESFTVPTIKNALLFFENKGIIVQEEGAYKIVSLHVVEELQAQYARDLAEILVFNLRVLRKEQKSRDVTQDDEPL